jgi:hypothetical protein
MKEKNIFKEMYRIVAGDHMVLLYDDETDDSNVSVIVSYILSRIEKNEKCFYITANFDTKNIIEQLKQYIDVDKVIEKGQLVILDKKEAYIIDGRFDPKKMIQLLKELSSTALDEGYNAFAITGELSWLLSDKDGFKRIMEYEYLLNQEIFSSYPVSAICRYNINKFSSSMIKNIIEVHPILIWKGQVHENPFYIDLVDTDNVDVEEYQVKSMLDTIENFTYTKSRFKNEI